jgi:cephalosporin hydroxylase
MNDFNQEVQARIAANSKNEKLKNDVKAFLFSSIDAQYSYNFSWLSRPIIQYPQDMVALQELIWKTRPDLIIETGIAHGGSLILSASMLALLDYRAMHLTLVDFLPDFACGALSADDH